MKSVRTNRTDITVCPSIRRIGMWDVYVGGFHRYTYRTQRGAVAYANRLMKEEPTLTVSIRTDA